MLPMSSDNHPCLLHVCAAIRWFEWFLCVVAQVQVTTYEGFTRSDSQIKWFWNVVQGFSAELKRKLLLFITGCAKARCAPR